MGTYVVSHLRNEISHAQFPGVTFRDVVCYKYDYVDTWRYDNVDTWQYDDIDTWREALMHMYISYFSDILSLILCHRQENCWMKHLRNIQTSLKYVPFSFILLPLLSLSFSLSSLSLPPSLPLPLPLLPPPSLFSLSSLSSSFPFPSPLPPSLSLCHLPSPSLPSLTLIKKFLSLILSSSSFHFSLSCG